MEKDKVKNKEDLIQYILLDLYNKVYPVDFGKYFMELMPSGGIDNFRSLLDELYEVGLLTKMSKPNGSVEGFPHLTTLDLRYGISVKGIEYLKNKTIVNNNLETSIKDVFVTYSWDSEEHNEKVLSFTNFLRDEGYSAEIDKLKIQSESALDFFKMMHQAMTDYKKVIVVLSKGYKEKAERFKGGVGNEYSLILKDIEKNKNKYILVSLESISEEITPLSFSGRYIIDLSNKDNLNELWSRLQDESIIEFSEVAPNKRSVIKKEIQKFDRDINALEIVELKASMDSSSSSGYLLTKIEYDVFITIRNLSNMPVNDYSIEVSYPNNSTNYDINGRIEGDKKVICHESNSKIFPAQSKSIKLERLLIRHYNSEELLSKSIDIKLYSDSGVVSKSYNLKDILTVKSQYGQVESLTINHFQDRNYR